MGLFQLWESLYKAASEQYINFPKSVFVAIQYHSYTEYDFSPKFFPSRNYADVTSFHANVLIAKAKKFISSHTGDWSTVAGIPC